MRFLRGFPLAIGLALGLANFAAAAADLGRSTWGDSVAAVLAAEGEPKARANIAGRVILRYLESIGEDSFNVLYYFIDDHLSQIHFSYGERHGNNNAYSSAVQTRPATQTAGFCWPCRNARHFVYRLRTADS